MRRGANVLLNRAMQRREITNRRLAGLLNVSEATLSRYRSGKIAFPPDVAVKAAMCLQCPEILRAYCEGCPVCAALERVRNRRDAA